MRFVLILLTTVLAFSAQALEPGKSPSSIYGTTTILGDGTGKALSVPGTGGYWIDRPNGANITRLNDRVIVGRDANRWAGNIGANGTDWPWTVGGGIFAYLPRNAQMHVANPFGSIAVMGTSRTTDSAKMPGEPTSGCCAMGLAYFTANDNTSVKQDAWGLYGTMYRTAGAGRMVNEIDVLNADSVVHRASAYDPGAAPDVTFAFALQAGGEGAPHNNPLSPPFPNVSAASAALWIGGNGSTWDKGVIFQNGSISPTTDGSTVAMEMPAGVSTRWVFDATGTTGAYVTSFVSAAARQMGMEFTDSGALFKNRAGTLFGQIAHVPNAVNRPVMSGSAAGQPISIAALGSDVNVDLRLSPKGGGVVRPDRIAIPFAAPASSTASCKPGEMQTDGGFVYVCVAINQWRRAALTAY